MPHDLRNQVVDFVRRWSEKTEIPAVRLVGWAGLARSKFFDWKSRYGKANEHNGWIPRDHWLEEWEEKAIIDFHQQNPLEGYRRLTFMMLDADIVAVSPASVYRVLAGAGLLGVRNWNPPRKEPALSSRWPRTSTGMWTSPTSTSAAPSTTCAACWTSNTCSWFS